MKQIFFLFVALLLSSCNIINPSEDEPAYVTIENIGLVASNSQGGNTHKITDAWVYINSDFIGTFQMPVTFPVLEEGEQIFEIFPGIKVNGITEIPDAYPFYERDSIRINIQEGALIELSPVVRYRDDADFVFVERFGEGSHQMDFDADSNDDTKITVVTDETSLDGASGYIHLDTATNAFFDVASVPLTEVPTNANSFYLEMDYKTDLQMNVGLVAYDILGTVIGSNFNQGVTPKSVWNKIYLDLSGPVNELKNTPTFNHYRLHFTAAILSGNDEDRTEADIFWDNIKLVKFD